MSHQPKPTTSLEGKIYFRVFYDGSRYRGWARQRDKPTLQAVFSEALQKTGAKTVGLKAFSRTDAEVNAASQIVMVMGSCVRPRALNRVLPEDVSITHYATRLGEVKSKTYVYVCRRRWRNPTLVAKVCEMLQQSDLLARLYKKGGAPPTERCLIELLSTTRHEYVFLKAKGFGYQQARKIVGYLELVDAVGSIPEKPSGVTSADPRGLILLNIDVVGDWVELEEGLAKVKRYLSSTVSTMGWFASLYGFMLAQFS